MKRNQRIILFEDDQNIRGVLEQLLKVNGHEIFTYEDPSLCELQHLHDCQCEENEICADIIITDIDMPNVSGLEFVDSQMRKGCKIQNIAVMSGAWSEEKMEQARNLGCEIFQKPFSLSSIAEWVDKCVESMDQHKYHCNWFLEGKKRIKERVISFLSEDETNSQYLVEQIERISTPELTDSFYSNLLDLFVHLSVEEEEAKQHWKNIFEHYYQICNKLDRDVGLRLSIFDYFINLNKSLESPLLVEIKMFKEAEQHAMFDPLTNLFNRRYFDIYLTKELRRARRYDKDFSVFLLDLDDFKKINDMHGHLSGDEVLRKFASFLKKMSREEDIICRFGGEEFIIILPETKSKAALCYANRIREAMKKDPFLKQHKVTFSGGIAQYPYGGNSAPQLIANADESLYDAKLAGKDQVLISKVENRKLFRYTKTSKIYLQPMGYQKGGDKPIRCITQDISLSGVRIEVNKNHKIGDKVLLTIELPDQNTIIVAGEIIWSSKNDDAPNTFGIKYVDLSAEQLKQMETIIPSESHN